MYFWRVSSGANYSSALQDEKVTGEKLEKAGKVGDMKTNTKADAGKTQKPSNRLLKAEESEGEHWL